MEIQMPLRSILQAKYIFFNLKYYERLIAAISISLLVFHIRCIWDFVTISYSASNFIFKNKYGIPHQVLNCAFAECGIYMILSLFYIPHNLCCIVFRDVFRIRILN